MGFLTVNGMDLNVVRDSVKETYYGQNVNRAYDGTPVSIERCFKRVWKTLISYATQAEAEALKGLLLGRGHNWGFDTSLYSGKGLASTFTRATTAYKSDGTSVLSGAARYENGPYVTNFATDKAITIEEGTTQIFTNSGFETGNLTGWTTDVSGGTGTAAANVTAKREGSYGAELTGGTAGVIIYQNGGSNPNVYSISFKIKMSDSSAVTNTKVQAVTNGSAENFDEFILISAGWYWAKKRNVTRSAGTWGVKVNATYTAYVDECLMEQKAYCTSYHPSSRNAETLTIPTSIFNPYAGTIAMWFKPTSIQVVTGRYTRLFNVYIDSSNWWDLLIHETGKPYWSVKSGGTEINTFNASDAVLVNDTWYFLAVYFGNGSMTMTRNGVNTASGAKTYTIPIGSIPANIYVGSYYTGAMQANGYYSCLSILPYTMTTAGLLAYYNLSRPCYALPRFEVTGTLVNRPTTNPMICRAEVTEASWHQFASQYQTLEVTLYEV